MRILSTKILGYAKKIKAIEYLGGKCQICGNDKWYHMEFHHLRDKKYDLSSLKDYRWSVIQEELDKCVLYCRNCHHEHHFNERNSEDKRQISKQIYLEYKGNKCEKCGYDKSQASLTFHHLNPEEKELQFSELSERISSLEDLRECIVKELDKCQLLCHNCHTEEHTEIDFFNKHKDKIIEKSNNMKEISKPYDVTKIMELYNSGVKQVDICKEMKATKGTISGIIKKAKLREK